jgi:hypothetical protein
MERPTMRNTSIHPPLEQLADLAEGRLDAEREREARAHLSSCRECAGQVATLESVTQLMRSDDSADAPRDVIFGAVRLFDSRRAAADERPGLLRRLVAALAFDSGSQRPAYGLRSGQPGAARQLLFSAGEGLDLDVRMEEGAGGWLVAGQVLGACEGGRAEAFAEGSDEPVAGADLNELCEFALPPLPSGRYALRLTLGGVEIEVSSLDLDA